MDPSHSHRTVSRTCHPTSSKGRPTNNRVLPTSKAHHMATLGVLRSARVHLVVFLVDPLVGSMVDLMVDRLVWDPVQEGLEGSLHTTSTQI